MKLVRSVFLRRNASFLVLILALRFSLTTTAQGPAPVKHPPTVVFMTDFGTLDDSVSICKGVMYEIAPDLRIVDLTHQVKPFSISDGARFLYGATPYYPAGTVFVVVIDPGVGTSRKAIVAKSRREQYFVLPDNGLLTLVADRDGIEAVREISNISWMLGSNLSSTFHGRDIFSPVGARIARGDDWMRVGPEVPVGQIIRLDLKPVRADDRGLSGEIIATDGPFGNLVTNISAEDFLKLGYQRGQRVPLRIGARKMTLKFVKTFGDVPRNGPLLYIDSRGRVGLAVNRGNFSAIYRIKPPRPIFIPHAGQ
jgi:S-adenosylmethionine hydrolase